MAETKHTIHINDKDLDKIIAKMRVFGKEVNLGDKQLEKLEKSLRDVNDQNPEVVKLNDNFNRLGNTVNTVAKGMVAMIAVDKLKQLGAAVVEITAEFSKLRASLSNALGSESEGQLAFSRIARFAAETPFQIQGLTESFVKLVQRGFIPTNKELTLLGDLAASQVKDFDQLVEALLDAQTGQFIRLREFGIIARQHGDTVSFSFKGVTTEVENTEEAIKAYILSLGELEGIQGGMAAVSETLYGKISNLDDAFDILFDNIGQANSGVLVWFVDNLAEITEKLSDMFELVNTGGKNMARQNIVAREIDAFNNLDFEGKERELATTVEWLEKNRKQLEQLRLEYLKLYNMPGNDPLALDELLKNIEYAEVKIAAQEELVKLYTKAVEAERLKQEEANAETVDALGLIKALQEQIKGLRVLRDESRSEAEIQAYNERIALAEEEIKRLQELGARKKGTDLDQIDTFKMEQDAQKDALDESLTAQEKRLREHVRRVVKENEAKTKALMEQEREIAEFRKEMGELSYSVGVYFTNSLFDAEVERGNQRLAEIRRQREEDIAYAGDNEKRKAEINRAAALKEEAIRKDQVAAKRKQAMFNRAADIFEIYNSSRVAYMQAVELFPITGGMPWSGLAIALGALHAGAVLAQPLPKYAKGKFRIEGPGTKTSDSIQAMLSAGESVVPADKTDKFGWLLKPMIEKPNFGEPDLSRLIDEHMPFQLRGDLFRSGRRKGLDYDRLSAKIAAPIVQAIESKEDVILKFDKEGFTASLIKSDRENKILNNRY